MALAIENDPFPLSFVILHACVYACSSRKGKGARVVMGSIDASKQNVYMNACMSPEIGPTDRQEQTLRVNKNTLGKREVGGNTKTQHNKGSTMGESKGKYGKRKKGTDAHREEERKGRRTKPSVKAQQPFQGTNTKIHTPSYQLPLYTYIHSHSYSKHATTQLYA